MKYLIYCSCGVSFHSGTNRMLRKLPFFDFETQIFVSACFSSQRTAGREGRSMKRGRRHFFLFSSCFYLGNPGRGPSFAVLYWAGQDFLRFARKMEHIRATSAEVKPVWTSPTLTIFIRLHCFCSTRSKNMYTWLHSLVVQAERLIWVAGTCSWQYLSLPSAKSNAEKRFSTSGGRNLSSSEQQMHKAFVLGSHLIRFVQKYFHVVGIA